MTDSRAAGILKKAGQCFSVFEPYRILCQDIAENFYPMRADFTQDLQLQSFASTLMDGTALNARETLGNAIDAMLRQGNWFKVGTGDKDRDERPANSRALQRSTDVLFSAIHDRRSNWSAAIKEADMDWVSFGNPVMSVEESSTRDYVLFRAWHPKDCAWVIDEENRLQTFYRKMMIPAWEIMRKVDRGIWKGTVSQDIRTAADKEPLRPFEIMHCMMPADEIYGSDGAKMRELSKDNHRFISTYLDVGGQTLLSDKGSPVFMYVAPRLRTLGRRPYGLSPYALNSIADSRMLQDMALVIIEQGQKAVDPPTIGAQQVFSRDMNLFAGGHTEIDLGEGQKIGDVFTTVDTGQRLNEGLVLKQDVRMMISEAWLLNKLMLPTLRDMREVEVMVRTEEFRRAALPFFQPIEQNYSAQVLSMAWDVTINMGRITPEMFPPELRDRGIEFSFESPLNEAEGRKIVEGYFAELQILAAGAQADQTVNNIYDVRAAAERAIIANGGGKNLVPEEQRKAKEEEAATQAELAKSAQLANAAAGTVANMAGAKVAAEQAGMI